MTDYAALSRRQIEERLAAAEALCVAFAWSPARSSTDTEKAAHELWRRWSQISGDSCNPQDHPELSPSVIAALARRRDEIRAETLNRLHGDG